MVNDAWLKAYGFSIHEVLGRTPWMITAPGFPEKLSAEIQRATVTGGWHGRVHNCTRCGREIRVFLLTRSLETRLGMRNVGLACLQGEEEGLMAAMFDLFCKAQAALTLPSTLSRREREVAALLAAGHSQKEIAWRLRIAPSTVRVLVVRIRAKRLGQSC